LIRDGAGELVAYPVDRGSGATTSLAYADGVVEMPADTRVLPAGEGVTVERFSTADRPPSLLAVGESDPGFAAAIAEIDATRYRTIGASGGARWLQDGIADVAVLTDETTIEDGETLATWTREWGLVLGDEAADIESLDGLADGDNRLVNRDRESGLRAAFDVVIDERAEPEELRESIDGYGVTVPGVESPARRVARGEADVGLGLRSTASDLGMAFLPLGTQRVQAVAASDRIGKSGVESLSRAFDEPFLTGLDGYAID
jgi:molybdate-binding protein